MSTRLAILSLVLAVTTGLFIGVQTRDLWQREDPILISPTGLFPCTPHMAESVIEAEYNDRVRRTLHIGTESDSAELGQLLVRAVETPGWADPEWVVSIVVSRHGETVVELVEAESSVWIANSGGEGGRHLTTHPVPVASRRFSESFPVVLGQELGRIWQDALVGIKQPVGVHPMTFDGTTYTLLGNAPGGQRLCGETTTDEPRRLLEIARLLRDYAKGTEGDRAAILDLLSGNAI